jgi:antitoxin HigA-1
MNDSDKIPNVHPKATLIPATRISQIIKGNRRITADTALRFGKFFGNSADFWLGIQMEYDLRKEKAEIEYVLEKIEEYH